MKQGKSVQSCDFSYAWSESNDTDQEHRLCCCCLIPALSIWHSIPYQPPFSAYQELTNETFQSHFAKVSVARGVDGDSGG